VTDTVMQICGTVICIHSHETAGPKHFQTPADRAASDQGIRRNHTWAPHDGTHTHTHTLSLSRASLGHLSRRKHRRGDQSGLWTRYPLYFTHCVCCENRNGWL